MPLLEGASDYEQVENLRSGDLEQVAARAASSRPGAARAVVGAVGAAGLLALGALLHSAGHSAGGGAAETGAAVVLAEDGGSCCSLPWDHDSFAQCNFWGDPHYSERGFGLGDGEREIGKPAMGVFRVAASSDGQFEVQSMQCSWNKKTDGSAIIVGLAYRVKDTRIAVVNSTWYVNGTAASAALQSELQGLSVSGSLEVTDKRFFNEGGAMHGTCQGHKCASELLRIMSDDCCFRASVRTKTCQATPHFFLNGNMRQPAGSTSPHGICGVGKTFGDQVGCDDLLFDEEVLAAACSHCTDPDRPPQCQPNFCAAAQQTPAPAPSQELSTTG